MSQKLVTIASCLAVALASLLSAMFVVNPGLVKAYKSPGSPSGFVNDFAGVIDDTVQTVLESDLSAFSDSTSNQIVVATVNSLEGDSIENFANELFREWGVGGKDRNNGVLLLVSPGDRQVRIEVGYGLEGAITDLESGRIIDGVVLPAFREGDYAKGIVDATDALKIAAREEYSAPATVKKSSSIFNSDVLFFLFFVFVWVSSFLARSKSWWAGGVIGAIIAGIGWLVLDSVAGQIVLTIFAPILGLFLDWLVSRNYKKNIGFFTTRNILLC